MRCTCPAADGAHHHSFGGTFGCDGAGSCRRCQEVDERMWHDEADRGATPNPSRQARAARRYIQKQYGQQTARILYGRDDDPMED